MNKVENEEIQVLSDVLPYVLQSSLATGNPKLSR